MHRRTLALVSFTVALLLAVVGCTDPAAERSATTPSDGPSTVAPVVPSPQNPQAQALNVDQLGVIGDSLTAEMIDYGLLQPALEDAGWAGEDIRMDGVWGRPIDGTGPDATSAVINAWRADGFDPRVWLIALGTNNLGGPADQWQQDVRSVLNVVNSGSTGNYTVYWVTTGYLDDDANNEGLFLQTMQDIAADYPNVVVADYGAYLDEHRDQPDWPAMWTDPVHHSEAGYAELRTPFYLATLQPEAPS